ncbi:MAG TPA: glycosyltransferase family 4 protein [Bacteroidota bacterium]|nr:glycosyltransferase family 4 protein [Bacteroidota bacterium]
MIRWCSAVKLAGANKVSLIQRFHRNADFELDGVRIHLISDEFHNKLTPFDNPKSIHSLITQLRPDVIHHNGWTYPLLFLHPHLPNTTSIVWQHHGGGLPQWYSRWYYKSGFRAIDACFFTSTDLSNPWKEYNIIDNHTPIYELIESSTTFRLLSQEQSRKKLNISGHPIFLWVGRLNRNKDPITILRGFRDATTQLDDPHLYMIFHDQPLLEEVQQSIKQLQLRHCVHLIGKVQYNVMETYLNASDYFILGSHHEGSGYALLEALSCGVFPIVTDIPSFRNITSHGKVGKLWQVGNHKSLSAAILSAVVEKPPRETIRQFFDQHLSFEALGRTAMGAYNTAYQRKNSTRKKVAIIVPGGIGRPDSGMHIPSLANNIAKLSDQFDMVVYSLISPPDHITEMRDNVLYVYLPFSNKSLLVTRLYHFFKKYIKHSSMHKFDLVNGMWGFPCGFLAVLIGKLQNIPSIVSLLGGESANLPSIKYGYLRNPFLKKILQWICSNATSIVTLSKFQSEKLQKNNIQLSTVNIIPNGVDTTFFQFHNTKLQGEPYRFLHVGNLNAVKDQATLVKAFAKISQQYKCQLRIIGADFFSRQVQHLVQKLGITSQVEFLGYRPYLELATHYMWADIFLLTSLHEGGGDVIMEATATGAVVCGTRVGLLADLGSSNVIAVEPQDSDALADEILKLLENKERYQFLQKNALQWSVSHNLNWTASQLCKVYNEAIEHNQLNRVER